MLDVTHNRMKRKQMQKMVIVLALLLCFVIAPLIAELYIALYACKEHDHNIIDFSCTKCALVKNINEFLRQTGTSVKAVSFAFVSVFLLTAALYITPSLNKLQTPVNLKIRINN